MNALSPTAKKRLLIYGAAVLIALALLASAILPLDDDTQGKFRSRRNVTPPPPPTSVTQPFSQPGQESIFQPGQESYTQTDDIMGNQIIMPNEIVMPNEFSY